MTKTFYITTPIFYPNAKLHLGHAYTTTVTDIAARYHRLIGDETYFLTGSDENTQKMVDAATKAGVVPMEFLDGIVANFASLYASPSISADTTSGISLRQLQNNIDRILLYYAEQLGNV